MRITHVIISATMSLVALVAHVELDTDWRIMEENVTVNFHSCTLFNLRYNLFTLY